MRHLLLVCFVTALSISNGYGQEKVYSLDRNKDLVLTGLGIGMNLLSATMDIEGATVESINSLDQSRLWALDRSAISNYSQNARAISDVILYSSLTFPLLVYADRKCRSEGFTIGIMGLETLLLTTGITTLSKVAVERHRPFTYNPDVPLDVKLGNGSTLSFFSGHTSVTTALSYFGAKVLTDLHPDSKHKWMIWTAGAVTPAVIGYLRYEAGKHFLTDVIAGYALGAVLGYMVPAVHLNKNVNLGVSFAGTLDFRITF